jgi:membrane fusion protein (multidrug efflux system)
MALREQDRVSRQHVSQDQGSEAGSDVSDPASVGEVGASERARTAAPTNSDKSGQDRPSDRNAAEDGAPGNESIVSKLRRYPWAVAAAVIVIIAIVVGVLLWWLHARHFESTDDAFIDARTVQISAQVAGQIVNVAVSDNQSVAEGAVLVSIDPRNYLAAQAQARAQFAQAKAQVANLGAQIDAQQAKIVEAERQVTQAQAALDFSQQENRRYQDLLKQGAGTEQRAQQANSDLTQKTAALAGAKANATAADKQLTVLRTQRDSAKAQVQAARAALDKANADLDRTTIVAPTAGRIANLSAAKGDYAQPAQALMNLVPNHVWVTANFKETELADMRAGQPVDIEIDAYPGKVFHGHVASIQPGSGAAFSLLPAENATGNFVKVVQRVPVKITFDKSPSVELGPGMSVVPSVKVR